MYGNPSRPSGAAFRTARTRAPSPIAASIALLAAVMTAAPSFAQKIIDPDPNGLIQNETSVALVPGPVGGQPPLLAVAYNNDPTGPTGLGTAISNDAGVTWMLQVVPMPLDPGGSGLPMTDAFDPAAAFDLFGQLFVAQISTLGGWPGPSGLFVTRYDPPSGMWFPPATVSYDPAAAGVPDPFYRFNDKCHLTVDRDPLGTSPYANNLYAVWIRDGGAAVGPWSDIFFASSANQGATWNYPGGMPAPVPINDNPYVPLGNPPFDMANGPNVAVSPTGIVYVAWTEMDVTIPQSMGSIRLDRSFDGGFTWGTDITVQGPFLCTPGNLSTVAMPDARARSFACLAVSPLLNPQQTHDVYLVYPADPDGLAGPDEADVFFTRSTNDGATWSPALRVNQDATPFDQFQPWIAVKPNGWIDIAWYDRRNDPIDTQWDVMITRSIDRGMTFAPELVLTATGSFASPHMTWGERWMGEYLGLAVDQTHAYVAFTSSLVDTLGDVYFVSTHNFAISTAAPELPEGGGSALRIDCPNPYRPEATVRFALPEPGTARVTVHDPGGRLVAVVDERRRDAGEHAVAWDGRDREGRPVAAGVYFLRLEANGGRVTEKVALLR